MQLLVDFIPLLLFLGTYLRTDNLFDALVVLMIAMPISFLVKWRLTGKIDKMLLGSTVLLLILGSATLLFRNPLFLYWKPTAFYWLAAVAFLGSQYIGDKTIVERLFASVGEMAADQWVRLNITWVVFFVLSGILNLYVAFNFSEKFWVKFKVFGFTAIMFVFILLQMIWLSKHLKEKPTEHEETE